MEVNRKRAKVHRLPTGVTHESPSYIYIDRFNNDKLTYDSHQSKEHHDCTYFHLYFTTDEEIKEGDKILWEGKIYDYQEFMSMKTPVYTDYFKIIATTDPKLLKPQIKQVNWIGSERIWSLPQIPQSFIEEYCKAGGIDKVLVEYECLTSTNTIVLDFSKVTADEAIKSDRKCIESRLKTDSNNCIIIHPVEEKTYSRKEVESKLQKFRLYSMKFGLEANVSNKWIKENL